MTCQEKTETRLQGEPASEDMTLEVAREPEVPVEDAVMPVGKPRKRRRDRSGCTTQNSTNKGHYPGVLRIPEGTGRNPQRDDTPCGSGTAGGKLNRENSDQGEHGTENLGTTEVREERQPTQKDKN
jgi:hypothetical protein